MVDASSSPEHRSTPVCVEPKACAHHWLINPPAAPLSNARCLRCDATRVFENGLDDVGMMRGAAERRWEKVRQS